ncbi:MAG: hypothetical protein PHQ08_03180, partial [Candidatus Pacebacteria bacterium]|nr:hypothetical protein [Candidatus Paceibacterota bacterium]
RPHPIVRLRRTGKRAKIHFPHTPFSFCPLAFGIRLIFFADGLLSNSIVALAPPHPCAGDKKELP